MPYIKQTWVDLPSHATPLSAERLSYIEDGIEAATELAEAIASPIATDVDFTPTGSVSSTNVQAAIMEVVADFNAALSSIDLSSKVSKSGDTMSGPLTITTDDDLHPIQVWKDEAGVVRAMMLADASTQTPSEGTPRFFMPMANQVAGGAAVTERAFELFTSDDEWAVDIDFTGRQDDTFAFIESSANAAIVRCASFTQTYGSRSNVIWSQTNKFVPGSVTVEGGGARMLNFSSSLGSAATHFHPKMTVTGGKWVSATDSSGGRHAFPYLKLWSEDQQPRNAIICGNVTQSMLFTASPYYKDSYGNEFYVVGDRPSMDSEDSVNLAIGTTGTAGNSIVAFDNANFSQAGDVGFALRVAMVDWTPASNQVLFAKYAAASAGLVSYQMYVGTTGLLSFTASIDGLNGFTAASTAAPTITDGSYLWLYVTREASTGFVNFYTAPDQSGIPSSWTLLGTANRSTVPGDLYNSAPFLEIGSQLATTGGNAATSVKRFIVYNGIPGSIVADFDASSYKYPGLEMKNADLRRVTIQGSTAKAIRPHVADSFIRANSTTNLGSTDTGNVPWVQTGVQDWGISSNLMYKSSNVVGASSATVETGTTDHDVRCIITQRNTANTQGLVARWQDNSNYYYLEVPTTGIMRLLKVVAGVTTILASGTIGTSSTTSELGLRVRGSTIEVLNANQITFSTTDTSLTSGTKAGIWSDGSASNTIRVMNFRCGGTTATELMDRQGFLVDTTSGVRTGGAPQATYTMMGL